MTEPSSSFQTTYTQRIHKKLREYLDLIPESSRLNEAIAYSVLNGGKRIRPLLIYATGLDLKVRDEALDAAACAVELIHCYSLIHDDLPAMDNDELRRGKATCHVAFDEATAILAGDALQSLAFEILSVKNVFLIAENQIAMLHCLAKSSGISGMAAGQMLDLQAENKVIKLSELEKIHRLKTGTLISVCLELAGLAANCSTELRANLIQIGFHLGLAFQIQDDILDIEGKTETLGKNRGADQARDKSTYPKLLGLESAKLKFRDEYQQAKLLIQETIPHATYLNSIINQLFNRDH